MFSELAKNSIDNIGIIEVLINSHEELSIEKSDIRQKIKIFSVSSCVTRLYAIYEHFVETAISDYLDGLSECVTFMSLSNEFKSNYRLGISQVLSKIDQERYTHLKHEDIIKWYHDAIYGSNPYRFVTDALTKHEENLRLNTIENLFSKIQLKDLNKWLSNHPSIKSLYAGDISIYTQLEAEIRGFIQLRNDASHGTLESIEGKDNLKRFCELVRALIIAISSFLRKSLLLMLQDAGKVNEIGVVTETFESKAFIAVVNEGVNIYNGGKIYLLDNSNCYSQIVKSLMICDTPVCRIKSKKDKLEIGLKCSEKVRKKTKLYMFL